MNTANQDTTAVTLQPSADAARGLISFSIYRSQFRAEESLEEVLSLLTALTAGVVGVVQQNLPGARVEVGLPPERLVNHYVLGEVFSRAKNERAPAVNPSSPVLAHVGTAPADRTPGASGSSPEYPVLLD